jgi:hypothetical protein
MCPGYLPVIRALREGDLNSERAVPRTRRGNAPTGGKTPAGAFAMRTMATAAACRSDQMEASEVSLFPPFSGPICRVASSTVLGFASTASCCRFSTATHTQEE